MIKGQKELMRYFPDRIRKGQTINRPYFFNVVNTLLPAYLKKLLEHANVRRHHAGIVDPMHDYIELSDVWYKRLMEFPFISSKYFLANPFFVESKGKTIQLLKHKSKPVPQTRKRRKIGLACTLEEFKEEEKPPTDTKMEAYPQQQTLLDNSGFKDITGELKYKLKPED